VFRVVKIVKNQGFGVFRNMVLVGAFCDFGVSDTGSPVHFSRIFAFLRHFRQIRGWCNIVWGSWGLVGVCAFDGCWGCSGRNGRLVRLSSFISLHVRMGVEY